MIAYLDTSAFVKLLIDEPFTAEVRLIRATADRVVSSLLLYPEACAAVAAAARARRLRPSGVTGARREIRELWAEMGHIDVTSSLVMRAGGLAEARALRGYDAVHLASALALDDAEVLLVTADRRLREAAQDEGLLTAPIA